MTPKDPLHVELLAGTEITFAAKLKVKISIYTDKDMKNMSEVILSGFTILLHLLYNQMDQRICLCVANMWTKFRIL